MSIQSLHDLSGKVAIVTGGGNGIGKACCGIFAEAGASVVVGDINMADAETVVREITGKGGNAVAVSCNVMQDRELVNLVESAVKTFGAVNILE